MKKTTKIKLRGYVVGTILILIGLIAGGVLMMTELAVVGFFVFALCAGSGAIFISVAKDKAKTICDECGASLIGCEVTYQMDTCEHVASNNGKAQLAYAYQVNISCPKCGAEKEYVEKFRIVAGKNADLYMRNIIRKLYKIK